MRRRKRPRCRRQRLLREWPLLRITHRLQMRGKGNCWYFLRLQRLVHQCVLRRRPLLHTRVRRCRVRLYVQYVRGHSLPHRRRLVLGEEQPTYRRHVLRRQLVCQRLVRG